MRALVLAMLVACAPVVSTPADEQRAHDTADARALGRELSTLPGAVAAHVTLSRAVVDPFTGARTRDAAGAVIVVDDRSDVAALTRSAAAIVRAATGIEPAIAVEIGAARPRLAHVGPFVVEVSSRRLVIGALAAAFATIALLAGWIAWRERWRVLPR